MPHRIEIASTVEDTRAKILLKKLKVKDLKIVDAYIIDKSFTKKQLQDAAEILINPLVQKYKICHSERSEESPTNVGFSNKLRDPSPAERDQDDRKDRFDYVVEIGYLPGVTDNVAHTAREMIEDSLKIKFKDGENVYTAKKYFITGELSKKSIDRIVNSLFNPLIQRAIVKNKNEYEKTKDEIIVPRVRLLHFVRNDVDKVDLHVSDKELEKIGKLGIEDRGPLALPLIYMKTIQNHFKKLGRNPTDIELESLAQTWSEHCKHTIFRDPIDDIKNGLFKTYIKGATEKINKDFCVSVFTDNSGIISFDENFNITYKVETHNTPSALDPFGGAVTGIVGVNRDTIGTGMGAKPAINFYGFCLADPMETAVLYRDKERTQPMLSACRIMDGVIDGVNYGGNCSGIPTPQGFLFFDKSYRGKPLVFVGTVGVMPKKIAGKLSHIKKANAGDYIVMIGGRVGLDGIHGATFSSVQIDSSSPSSAVQIGDPITQKKFSDALVKEARDRGLYTSITDCGAGGLSSSVSEMAKESGGCIVDLEKVPLKYPGLTPWQIWISESQERMTLAVPPTRWNKLEKLLKKRGVEATVIGKFTESGKCVVKYNGEIVMDLDMDFLHEGLPARPMVTKRPKSGARSLTGPAVGLPPASARQSLRAVGIPSSSVTRQLISLLSDYNFASTEFISAQYDHEVQGGSVLKPLQGKGRVVGDTTVTRPVLSSEKGVILSQALYPTYTDIDPYQMAACSIDTAIRNIVATGGDLDHLALLDNFCWCSSDDPKRLWQLKEAVRGCHDFAVAYGTPFISGKDSMFNDFKGYDSNGKPIKISALPTLLISAIGVVSKVSKVVSLDFKSPGDLVYVLGETVDDPLLVDAKRNEKLYRALAKAIEKKLAASSISVHRGGTLFALARSAIGGQLGVDFPSDEKFLYPESQGRILVSVNPKNINAFETLLKGNYFCQIGEVRADKKFLDTTVDELTESYKSTFKSY